ncbi:MAG TPA: isoprenylcysteine carboxylmethyltransferase family protein [Spirochaetota bacterium]|nr:isoprenylcysteine carboxylmethyltransferase family protein [Spirochaetota bacterium]HOM39132.1 isoprenylcysteine carboxylmethyltransferase family protein [Spirochaetota bacterium]HPQ50015.1 isoprenylcysteine carboxylmethyltransferase family protein [Spirochaetota bacterium]
MKNFIMYIGIIYIIYTVLRIKIERIAKKRKKIELPEKFKKKINRDKYLLKTLTITEIIIIFLYALKIDLIYYFNYSTPYFLQLTGLILGYIGILIICIATITLDGEYSATLEFKENHRLVNRGIYKKIRHPIYLGFIILHIGVSLALSNYIATIIWIGGLTFLLILRVPTEENLLLYLFKNEFIEYKRKTGRFLPLICNKRK